jgi:hypothetical protein
VLTPYIRSGESLNLCRGDADNVSSYPDGVEFSALDKVANGVFMNVEMFCRLSDSEHLRG